MRQPVLTAVGSEPAAAVPNQQAVLGRGPQRPFAVLAQHTEPLAADPLDVGIEHDEPRSVEADQAAEGGQPEVAVAGLDDVVDRTLRQAVVGRPLVVIRLRRSVGRDEPDD